MKNDDYERLGGSGWQNGVYEYSAPEDVYVEIVLADESDYNQASRMSTTEVEVQIFLLDNYAAQVLSECENALAELDSGLTGKTDHMDITAKGEVILTDNRYPEISGYSVFLGGKPLLMLYDSAFNLKKSIIDYFEKRCFEVGFDGIYLIETYMGDGSLHDLDEFRINMAEQTELVYYREPSVAMRKLLM